MRYIDGTIGEEYWLEDRTSYEDELDYFVSMTGPRIDANGLRNPYRLPVPVDDVPPIDGTL